ncbi:MAG: response regulator [Chitinophagaceae bacterium]|nr:response regulator [Chitinophagaceae bacterium]
MKTSLDILYIGQNPAYFEPLKNNSAVSISVADSTISGINHLMSGKRTDAVFCDFGLSGANGFYMYDWIREQKKFNTIPFILLSKEFRDELYKTAYDKHVDDYYVTSQHMPLGLTERIEFLCRFRQKSKKEAVTETDSVVYKMPFSKRLFDIVVASTILLVLSPILLLILLAIRLESKGIFTSSVPCARALMPC